MPRLVRLHLETDRHRNDAVFRSDGIPTAMTRADIVHQPLPARTHLPMTQCVRGIGGPAG